MNCYYFKAKPNFGDALVPPIIKWISGKDVKYVSHKEKGKLLCIGSGINSALQDGDIVWGYGSREESQYGKVRIPDDITFLAVRGYKTWEYVKDHCPKIVGDPASIMPKIYTPKSNKKLYSIGVVPHYIDKPLFENIKDEKIKMIDILDDHYKIIDELNQCDVIISTSLHACIVAEAYGIPVMQLKVNDKVAGYEHKWNDYFSATGRDDQKAFEIKREITTEDIVKMNINTLPKPIINTEPLIKAWKDHFKDDKTTC